MKKLSLLFACILIASTGFSQSWNTTGNTGTTPATNFIGTTDNEAVLFKVYNQVAGFTGNDVAQSSPGSFKSSNVSFGYSSLKNYRIAYNNTAIGSSAMEWNSGHSNTAIGTYTLIRNTGEYNTAIGAQAMEKNTSGRWNAGLGSGALFSNTTGYFNTAVGTSASWFNTTGSENVAVGVEALSGNIDGNFNTAVGTRALWSVENVPGGEPTAFGHASGNTAVGFEAIRDVTTGYGNVGIGKHSLAFNTTGRDNMAIGNYAMFKNTTGVDNVAIGSNALGNNKGNYNISIGSNTMTSANLSSSANLAIGVEALYKLEDGFGHNLAIGHTSLRNNTTGQQNAAIGSRAMLSNISGSWNIAFGIDALRSNTTGKNNMALGYNAMFYSTTGNNNTATGLKTMHGNTTGSNNTAYGFSALSYNKTGTNNTAVGYGANVGADNLTNVTVIGNGASVSASNSVRIGNAAVTSIGGQVGWSTLSDGRVKTNIQQNVPGLDFINRLQPVTYNVNPDAIDKIMKINRNNSLNTISQEEIETRVSQQKQLHTGFVAQDVEKAAKELGYEFSGVDAAQSENGLYALRYSEFVVPLVKAVQELSEQNTSLQNQVDLKDSAIASLQEQITSQQSQIDELKELIMNHLPTSIENTGKNISIASASLEQNAPNPFDQFTKIQYTLPESFSSAKMVIVDNTGKTLKQIALTGSGTGIINIEAGSLNPGVYYYSLYVDGQLIDTKKMILKN